MAWQQESLLELMSPSSFDETQVELLVRAIDFVTYNRVAYRGEMHPNLMRASRARNRTNKAEPIAGRRRSSKPPFNKEFCLCWRARGMQAYAAGIAALIRKPFGGIGTLWIQLIPTLCGLAWRAISRVR